MFTAHAIDIFHFQILNSIWISPFRLFSVFFSAPPPGAGSRNLGFFN
jgi:hypothetical protein